MSYQVLARKWRPRFFREMVGQEHVLQALINALDHNRLHHAYLFTGTRGVGKTTIARILAKCLNCESGISSEPCGECSSCFEINQGSFVDLIEVDAASRTKVEDTRELLDNVQYAPTKGRYKVYLIDEVHMLSTHSFNALLKTLEEPPEHVKFLLATTDPQKLPATILSRCLQFHLKNMVPERIVQHLQHILSQEMIDFDDAALWALARSADGSMRDGLSLTDQAIAFGSGKVTVAQVRDMLGSIDQQTVYLLAEALVSHDAQKLLSVIADFSEQAPDYAGVLDELLLLLHRMTVAQVVPDALDNSLGDKERVSDLAQSVSAEELQLFYQMGLLAKKDFSLAPDLRSGLEMAVLRMLVFRPEGLVEPPSKVLPSYSTSSEAKESGDSIKKFDASVADAAVAQKNTQEIPASRVGVSDVLQPGLPDTADVKTSASHQYSPLKANDQPEQIENETLSKVALSDSVTALSNSHSIPVSECSISSRPELDTSQAMHGSSEPTFNEKSLPLAESKSTSVSSGDAEMLSNDDASSLPETTESSDAFEYLLEELQTHEDWLSIFSDIPFNGLIRAVAGECVFLKREGDQLFFALDKEKAQLYNERHAQQIADVLSAHFSVTVNVSIDVEVSIAQKTPSQYLQGLKQKAYEKALSDLQNDVGVKYFVEVYGAEIEEQTVKPINI